MYVRLNINIKVVAPEIISSKTKTQTLIILSLTTKAY